MTMNVKPLCAAALALALITGCQQEQAAETGATEEAPAVDIAGARQAIDDAGEAWRTAALEGDAAAMAALYAENAVVQAPNAPRMTGRAAIQSGFADLLAAAPFTALTISTDAVEVSDSGDLAYGYGTYTSTNTLTDGTTIDDRGKWLSIHANQGGTWIYVADTWNSDLALPGMEEPENP